jgi:hypothetical protein
MGKKFNILRSIKKLLTPTSTCCENPNAFLSASMAQLTLMELKYLKLIIKVFKVNNVKKLNSAAQLVDWEINYVV